MLYIVGNKLKDIPTEKSPYDKGSEGKVYKKGKYIYKIYYTDMLEENFGKKEYYHKYLLSIPTKQIILPDQAIHNLKGEYEGYRTIYVPGNKKDKTGITKLESKKFIKNLQILEEDFELLSRNFILVSDISPINYIFNKKDGIMNIIDPGRYSNHTLDNENDYLKENNQQLNDIIEQLLYLDFIKFKPVKGKQHQKQLKEIIKGKRTEKNCKYSEFFEENLKDFETVEEYVKSLR
jgi:hypothetical protein